MTVKGEKGSRLPPVHPPPSSIHPFFIFSLFELTQTIATGQNLSQARRAEVYLPVNFLRHEATVAASVCAETAAFHIRGGF